MKNSFHAISTLSPVRRVATFFVFLGFLTLGSCQEKKESMSDLIGEQTTVFTEMAELLDQAREGEDPEKIARALTQLGEELKGLKIKTSAAAQAEVTPDGEFIPQDESFLLAKAAFDKAQQQAFMAGKITPEINRAIMAHHNSAPMSGEGTP